MTLRRRYAPALAILISLGGWACTEDVTAGTPATPLDEPSTLMSISLNRAIHLSWSDNPFLSAPARFDSYRIYSTSYDLDTRFCGASWGLEGTTVAPVFLVGAIANGVPRCFGVSSLSIEGAESALSLARQDTPRPDARNVLVWAFNEKPAEAGFYFWQDQNTDNVVQDAELGRVVDGGGTSIDFWVDRDPVDSTMWIVPESPGTGIYLYDVEPVADLTSIDIAPDVVYPHTAIEAVPGYGYVFRIVRNATLRYGALRVTHVGRDYVIFDWSFQTDFGNPELVVRGGLPVGTGTGSAVSGAR